MRRLLMALALAVLARTPGLAQSPDMQTIFADGFESGTLVAWPVRVTDGGDLAVTAAAALGGAFGLQATIDDVAGVYVQDDAPGVWQRNDDDSYYHAAFRFDPNGFDPGETGGARRTRIFIAFDDAPQRRLFAVVLRRASGQYALMGRVQLDDSAEATTGFHDITDDAHLVEVAWYRATRPDSRDGWFRLSIDGTAVSTLHGLQNHAGGLEFTRLGALSVKAGASGTLYWDDFRSARDRMAALAQLVINEVDYDQPGPDGMEFVEIYNPGPAAVDLHDGVRWTYLVYIDGATHGTYGSYPLGNPRLPAGGYAVLTTDAVALPPGTHRVTFNFERDNLGDGAPEGLALVFGYNDNCVVLDTLAYEGPISAGVGFPTCGIVDFVEGTALSSEIEDSDTINASLIRISNGSDTDDAATDWTFTTTPSPGAANVLTP